MSHHSSDLDRFTHALLSPLTTLQGTAQLLRRSLEGSDDPQVVALLDVLDRNVTRLRTTCERLVAGARIVDERVLIEIAAASFRQQGQAPSGTAPTADGGKKHHASPAHEAPSPPSAEAGPLLLITHAGGASDAIGVVLRKRGHRVVEAHSATDGLDRARELRPALVLVDPQVDAQGETALQILGEDPDTKTIPLAVLTRDGTAGGQAHTQISLEQPAEAAASRIEQILAPGAAGREGRPHILIIDDEPDITQVIALQFEAEGYLTTQIHSGTEGLRVVREQQFDLILLDLILPDLDGFTVLGGLRAQPETQLTPIILISAINSPVEKVRGLQLGADDYITKPFSPDELSARVQAAMRRSEREGGANPSTRLPGNIAIERAISQRIAQGQPFVVCYCDIDNFKAYNDSYGFLKGDAVIQRTAQMLLDTVRAHGNPDDFVGHIGGDDFVVISTPDRVTTICEAATGRFDETAPLFYDAATRARGFISGEDRQGRPATFPLVSITITVVSSARRPFGHPGDVAQRSIEGKKRGKLLPGSVYLIEE